MRKIAIIGGGCSGVLMALALLRRCADTFQITIFEPAEHLGRGVAYATQKAHHLLNVPAGCMGAWSDAHGDFFEWIQAEWLPAEASDFVPRMWFAKYLTDRLAAELKTRAASSSFTHCRAMISTIAREAPQAWRLVDSLGHEHTADTAILALGLPNVSWPRGVDGVESTLRALPVTTPPSEGN